MLVDIVEEAVYETKVPSPGSLEESCRSTGGQRLCDVEIDDLAQVPVGLERGPHRHVDSPYLALGTERSCRPPVARLRRRTLENRLSRIAETGAQPGRDADGHGVPGELPAGTLAARDIVARRGPSAWESLELVGFVD